MGQTASVITSTPTRRRRRKVMAAAVAMPIAATMFLAGCSAGQLAQTSEVQSEVPGVMANIGALHIRNASITAPTTSHFSKGSTLYLEMDIANDGAEDQLTAATIDGVDATIEPVSSSSSASSTPEPTDSANSANSSAVTIPASGIASINEEDNVVSADAKGKLYPAQNIDIVLTFKNAGELKMVIPIGVPANETPKVDSDKVDLHPNETKGEVD